MWFITLEKEQSFHFPNFGSYISFETLQFLLTGGAKIFLAPERRIPLRHCYICQIRTLNIQFTLAYYFCAVLLK